MKRRNERDFLLNYVETLQSKGCYWFARENVIKELDLEKQALAKAISRLIQKGKIIRLYHDFHIIVPAEYKKAGILPPTWFIDPLMRYMGMKETYYVGLLSAAALFGAAHQKVQAFQVLVPKTVRPIVHEKLRIKFINKRQLQKTPITKIKTDTGYISVSTPEATALDLIQYMSICGSLGNVATVLLELSDKLDAKKLLNTAVDGEYEFPVVQRLGYILEFLGKAGLVQSLMDLVRKKKPKYIKLRPDLEKGASLKNEDWRVIPNDVIEVDL